MGGPGAQHCHQNGHAQGQPGLADHVDHCGTGGEGLRGGSDDEAVDIMVGRVRPTPTPVRIMPPSTPET